MKKSIDILTGEALFVSALKRRVSEQSLTPCFSMGMSNGHYPGNGWSCQNAAQSLFIIVLGMLTLAAHAQTVCKCTIPVDNTFQVAPMTNGIDTDVGMPPLYQNNNATTPALPLPFHFCFYGHEYDSVYISNNGIVSFIKPIYAFIDSTQHFPLGADTGIIAPFFADANTTNNAGVVYYKITPTYMIVTWDSVRYAGIDVDGWNTFQLIISNGIDPIIPAGNNVSFCYPVIQWACSEASGGFSGYGGTPAFVGVNRGDGVHYAQVGTFSLPGNFYYGPFSTLNGVDWLDFQDFYFSTCASQTLIAPLVCNNYQDSDLYYICPCDTQGPTNVALGAPDSMLAAPCDTVSFMATFLCAGPGQFASLSYTVTGALNVTSVYTSTANIIDTIIVTAIPAFGDTGIHYLRLIATDSVNHLSSHVTYTIDVTTDCIARPPLDSTLVDTAGSHAATNTGIEAIKPSVDFSVYPNPAYNKITINYGITIGNAVAKIYDMMGKEIYSGAINGKLTNIDVSAWARGMYFVELIEGGISLPKQKIVLL